MEDWKTNLLCVSEKHRIVIFAIVSQLYVYELDILTFEVGTRLTIINLNNNNSIINNIRLVTCAQVDFIITVDEGSFVRMFYLDDLNREPIKFTN